MEELRRSGQLRLLHLLPQVFRTRDFEQAMAIARSEGFDPPSAELTAAPEGPLASLLGALGSTLERLEAEVGWLYGDQFIETCAPWVVDYIGQIVGARVLPVADVRSRRLQVANTIRERRSKGTLRSVAERGMAIMVAPTQAVEYRDWVVHAHNLNFPHSESHGTVQIMGMQGRRILAPDTLVPRAVEVRSMEEGGRFLPSNIGLRVWPKHSVKVREIQAKRVVGGDAGRYYFSPLGRNLSLWRNPRLRVEPSGRVHNTEDDFGGSGPIGLVEASDFSDLYYSDDESLTSVCVKVNGVMVATENICFCNLEDVPGRDAWNLRGLSSEQQKLRIDPDRGRLVVPRSLANGSSDSVRVTYYFGSALSVGGAVHRRDIDSQQELAFRQKLGEDVNDTIVALDTSNARRMPDDLTPQRAQTQLLEFLDSLGNSEPGGINVTCGVTLSLPENVVTDLPERGNFEVFSELGFWSTLEIHGSWTLGGGSEAVLTLRRLRVSQGVLRVLTDSLRWLILIDCTIVPDSASVEVLNPNCHVAALRCVLGPIVLVSNTRLSLEECVVDSGSGKRAAIAGAEGQSAGFLTARQCTFVGDLRVVAMNEVTDCIFAARPNRESTEPLVVCQRIQVGCVRYSAVPPDSVVPKRYRCYPSGSQVYRAPMFLSLNYGDVDYGCLLAHHQAFLLRGAENGGEIGVNNYTSLDRLREMVDRDLVDRIPFGMAVATDLRG